MNESTDKPIAENDELQASTPEPDVVSNKPKSRFRVQCEKAINANKLVQPWMILVAFFFAFSFFLQWLMFWRGPHHQVTLANVLLNCFGILLYSAINLLLGFGLIWLASRIFGARGENRKLAIVYPIAILLPTIVSGVVVILITFFSSSETPSQNLVTWPIYPILGFVIGASIWAITRIWCALRLVNKMESSSLFFTIALFVIMEALIPSNATRVLMPEAFSIPAGSMVPSLEVGDHILIDSNAYGMRLPFVGYVFRTNEPDAGEIVVFYNPVDPNTEYVKRIVAVGGDTISIQNGQILINEKSIQSDDGKDYSYELVDEDGAFQSLARCKEFQESVGKRSYPIIHKSCTSNTGCFVVGGSNCLVEKGICQPADFGPYTVPSDHVFVMGDNRDNSQDSRFFGAVPIESIKGKALWRFWPFGRVGPLD